MTQQRPTRSFQRPAVPGAGKPRLLVVEDNAALAKLFGRALDETYDVTVAYDGIAASKLLTEQSFDIILSDIMLPGISGLELLRLIRLYDLDVPVLLMTGLPTIDTAAQAVELGALGFLPKPVDLVDLEIRLARGVTLGRLARAKREAIENQTPSQPGPTSMRIGDRAGLSVRFESALRGMHLHLQPIASAKEKRVVAFEALMRSSEAALPTPSAVLDAAERLGTVCQLGRHVRELAAAAVGALPAGATLFVNVHADELGDELLFGGDCPLNVHAPRIVLEVTERASIDSIADCGTRARRLRAAGFRLAVDDFGAGYAGLSAFAALEPEIVKIDMGLIRGIENSIIRQRVVRSVVDLCRDMSVTVLAEGIETPSELACVAGLGCDLLQGFFLGRPGAAYATTIPTW